MNPMLKSLVKLSENIRGNAVPHCKKMFSWCKNDSMLKIKTLFRRLFSVTLFNLHKAETINRKMPQVLIV